MSDEKAVPTIILKLTDPDVFNVECDIDESRLHLVRAMLTEALARVTAMIQDQEAAMFAAKMNQAAVQQRAAQFAMQKKPRII
jgi:hypothetical protein